jgi:hypothetical protein
MQVLREVHATAGWPGVALLAVVVLASVLMYELAASGRVKAWVAGMFHDHAYGKLTGHALFTIAASLGNAQSLALKLPCPLRQAVGRDMCKFRLDALRDAMLEVAKLDTHRCTATELFAQVRNGRIKALRAWRKASDEAHLPPAAVDAFEQCLSGYTRLIDKIIFGLCGCSHFKDNDDKLHHVFDILADLEAFYDNEAVDMIIRLNGELSKSTYKGLGCRKCACCSNITFNRLDAKVSQ